MSHRFRIINWNVAGAKYLERKSESSTKREAGEPTRERFRDDLNKELSYLLGRHQPHIVTLQEVVAYSPHGVSDASHAEQVIDIPPGYRPYSEWLIDTNRHSHQGKWTNVRELGDWPPDAFFAQGNAILVHEKIPWFHIFLLPALRDQPEASPGTSADRREAVVRGLVEVVKLESGLYFGNRDTEPRAALVTHLMLSELLDGPDVVQPLAKPLDIFVVNLHLTTLVMEREGVPAIDDEAAQIRLRQLDILLNGIVSRYNRWRREGYPVRGKVYPKGEPHPRHPPIWIIAGDFNFTPESVEFVTMVRNGFIDMMPSHKVGTKASGLGKDPTLTVDYVFAGPRFEAIDPKVAEDGIQKNRVEVEDPTLVSDHFPLIVDVPIALKP
jgi:hypothetical protein